ncbi:hypothetical protein [Nocardia tengchongensis]|uniref:hypothetical protein n=1 Tax=Nocardia tengchongensis TaxID=2055889 RepID=UPI0036669D6E
MITAIFVAVWALAMAALPSLIRLACSEGEAEPSNLVRPTVYAWVREPTPTPILLPDWDLAGAWPL